MKEGASVYMFKRDYFSMWQFERDYVNMVI